ncbi:pyridoxamine 5'-phosphate oxidase family protein [Actinokineospora cianjurensis]|uniref:Pyridoxamine 5'-phosphate oxidase n=1 Tax=Actinokineospora cianjurensis TaxID=585224 RepID=A0A421B502_9PSEU|nr:pyridoxamine 5'-phosphate oxidase family protein [Actinokineospora cianjurensis]RLK59395.1 pyridoxamine 5'-phosphate oxidase [Actinokineospora cianjurensis]
MPLTLEEREQFLLEPHIGSLAVSADGGRGPRQVPIWYKYEPGGQLWITTKSTSRKARLIERAGRFSLLVERLSPTIRYVSVEGPAVGEPGNEDYLREMASRYVRPERLDAYLAYLKEEGQQTVFRLKVEHWTSADLGPA